MWVPLQVIRLLTGIRIFIRLFLLDFFLGFRARSRCLHCGFTSEFSSATLHRQRTFFSRLTAPKFSDYYTSLGSLLALDK